MRVLITGSSGLIGSEAVLHYDRLGADVVGIDNNMRQTFFGDKGCTLWNLQRLQRSTHRFRHMAIDVREQWAVLDVFARLGPFDRIIHCAAQPSHDRAKDIPLTDFHVNAVGTVNLLEATRQHSPEAVFIHMSTNKVYGDAPNELPLVEQQTRWEYARPEDYHGIAETCRIDRTLHSLFGASKTAADVMAQEYGRYFGLKVGIFRGGCLTGPSHAGVELHGFLSYLVHVAVHGKPYTVYGYKGKQVRDQIHSADVIAAFEEFANAPRPGEVYNLGGGRDNAASVLECLQLIEDVSDLRVNWTYCDQARVGDHICYISDLRKFRRDYPNWMPQYTLREIISEMVEAQLTRPVHRQAA